MVWPKFFARRTRSSIENLVLLISDKINGYCNFGAYRYCRENGILVISISPHSSHRPRALDVSVSGSFHRENDRFFKAKLLEKLAPYDLAGIFNEAYSDVATIIKSVA
jgi:hypothetical protein